MHEIEVKEETLYWNFETRSDMWVKQKKTPPHKKITKSKIRRKQAHKANSEKPTRVKHAGNRFSWISLSSVLDFGGSHRYDWDKSQKTNLDNISSDYPTYVGRQHWLRSQEIWEYFRRMKLKLSTSIWKGRSSDNTTQRRRVERMTDSISKRTQILHISKSHANQFAFL